MSEIRVRLEVGRAYRNISFFKAHWDKVKYDAMPLLQYEGVRKLKEEVPQPGKSRGYATGKMRDSVKGDFFPSTDKPRVEVGCHVPYDKYVAGLGKTAAHEFTSSGWMIFEKEGKKLVFPPGRKIKHPGSVKDDYYFRTAQHMREYAIDLIHRLVRSAPRFV